MLNLLKKISGNSKSRREDLLRIISPKIKEWTKYGDIVEIVKQKAPKMYQWEGGYCSYISLEFMEDLDALVLNGNLSKTPGRKKWYKIKNLGKAVS